MPRGQLRAHLSRHDQPGEATLTHAEWVAYLRRCAAEWAGPPHHDPEQAARVRRKAIIAEAVGEGGCPVCRAAAGR